MKIFLSLFVLAALTLASCNKNDDLTVSGDDTLLTRIKTDFKGEMIVTPSSSEDWAWEMRGDYLGTFETPSKGKELNYEIQVSHKNETNASVIGWDIPTLDAQLVYYPQEDMYSTFDGSDSDPEYIVNFHRGRNELSFVIKKGSKVYVGKKTQ